MITEKEAQYLHRDDRFTLEAKAKQIYKLKWKNPNGFVQVESDDNPGYTIELLNRNLIFLK